MLQGSVGVLELCALRCMFVLLFLYSGCDSQGRGYAAVLESSRIGQLKYGSSFFFFPSHINSAQVESWSVETGHSSTLQSCSFPEVEITTSAF